MHAGKIAALCLVVAGCSSEDEPTPASSTRASLQEQQRAFGWGAERCPAAPAGVATGYRVGEQVGALTLKDCDGAPFDLREVCGASAVWIAFAHAWCPHCKKTGSEMEGYHADYAAAGHHVAALNVVVQDAAFERPDGELCHTWRAEYGQDRVLTVYDDTGAWEVLSEESYTALNVILDGERVIAAKLYTDVEAEIRGAIDAAGGW